MHFQMPADLYFGSGTIQDIESIVKSTLKAVRPVLVTDKGVVRAGILDSILPVFNAITVFDTIEANPKSDTVNRIADQVRKIKPDLVIGVGGGSPMDAGKALALLATNPGDIQDYEGKAKYHNDPLPFLAVPTTCGTGSEVTWVSVITDVRRNFKISVKGPKLYPAAAIVDPDLIRTLPKPIIASTGLDALTHAVEAFLSRPATVITDTMAVRACQLILGAIEAAYSDIEKNREARENLMFGSMIAGFAFGNSDVTAVHCISESIGAVYDIPHGVANAIFLPYVLAYNMPACIPKMARLARELGITGNNDEMVSKKLITRIKDLSRSIEIPEFKALEIAPDQFDMIADMSFRNGSTPSNPRPLDTGDFKRILENAYSG